jgi:hypothetical protein
MNLVLAAVLAASVAPAGLKGVVNAERAPRIARDGLVQNGFAVVEGSEQHFFALYDRNAYEKLPSFISTDVVLHVFHARFDADLLAVEESVAIPALRSFAQRQLARALARWPEAGAPGALTRQAALYHATALRLLEGADTLDPRVAAEVEADAKKLEATSGAGPLAACPTAVEHSLFKPRGHYEQQRLRGYFRAFTFYSQCAFPLPAAKDRAADLVSLLDDASKAELAKVRGVLELVSGPSDDLTPEELGRDGGREPRVSSLLAGPVFVMLGGSWTPDAELFGRTGAVGDRMPSVLDVLAALGSTAALATLRPPPKLAAELSRPFPEGNGLYGRWLRVLRTLVTRPSAAPPFAATEAWAHHTLVSAAGSWAELKHDTILYVKQAMVMKEGGHDEELPPAQVGGYVEPRPDVYRELLSFREALARATGTSANDALSDLLRFVIGVSELELANKPFPKETDERLRTIGSELEHLCRTRGDRSPPQALIADVFTAATPEGSRRVLHAATGDVDELWVVVPRAGKQVLMRGGAFSYYEFAAAEGERLADSEWRVKLREAPPPRPAWAQPLAARKTRASRPRTRD